MKILFRLLPATAILVLVACGGESATEVPTTGSLTVTVATTGEELDPDGYNLVVGGVSRPVSGTSIQESFTDLPAGERTVELSGVADNCAVSGSNPRTVNIQGGATATVAFAVACSPTTGSLTVTVTTTGEELDPDGYSVLVDGTGRSIGTNDSLVLQGLDGGTYSVRLRGEAFNCIIAGENPRAVVVTTGETATTSFQVSCSAPLVTLDGIRGAGEWDGAPSIPLFSGANLLHRTDGTLLYLGVEVEDPTLESNDILTIRFDNDADGVLEAGENQLTATRAGFTDGHSNGTIWGLVDADSKGAAAVASDGSGTSFFEIAVPLDSGDPQDFSLQVGSTVGFCVIYTNDGTSTTQTTFPAACNRAGSDLSGYAQLLIDD